MHWGYNDEQNRFHHCPWGPHNLQVKTESSDSRSLLTDVGETDISKLTKLGDLTWFGVKGGRMVIVNFPGGSYL